MIRCTVAFARAVFDGEMTVEGVTARPATSSAEAMKLTERGFIPVMADPACSLLDELKPLCVVDAILAKQEFGNAGRYGTSNNRALGRALLQGRIVMR